MKHEAEFEPDLFHVFEIIEYLILQIDKVIHVQDSEYQLPLKVIIGIC
jgi:hypothetical protein